MAKKQKLADLGAEGMILYKLPGNFYLFGSLDKKKNITALWASLYRWEECFEEDYDKEEDFKKARKVFDDVFKKALAIIKKKLGKPVMEGVSKDEDAFRYACFVYKKDSVLCLEQNDRDIQEGMEVTITLSPLRKGKVKPVFVCNL